MSETAEVKPREAMQAIMDREGITLESVFVPFSRSRSAGDKLPNLNWTVTLKKAGRAIVTTDYSAGQAHCPAYESPKYGVPHFMSIDRDTALRFECENGRTYKGTLDFGTSAPILPDAVDVLWSLTRDADVLDAGGFENWASDYGFDADSRKAEATYRACLEIALKLRSGLGDAVLAELQEAGRDY